MTRKTPVQGFIRNFVRWGIAIPLWLLIAKPNFAVVAAEERLAPPALR